jgi:hypothetical protein
LQDRRLGPGTADRASSTARGDVDAVPTGAKPGTKPTPYELFAVYEKTGAWKLVHAQFAVFGARGL